MKGIGLLALADKYADVKLIKVEFTDLSWVRGFWKPSIDQKHEVILWYIL